MNEEAAASVAEGGIGGMPAAGPSGVAGIIEAGTAGDGEELMPGGGAYLVFLPGPIEKLDVAEGAGGGGGAGCTPGAAGKRNTPGCGGPSDESDEVEETVLIEGDLVLVAAAEESTGATADGTMRAGCGPKESAIEKHVVEASNGLGEPEACGGGIDIIHGLFSLDLCFFISRIQIQEDEGGLEETSLTFLWPGWHLALLQLAAPLHDTYVQ